MSNNIQFVKAEKYAGFVQLSIEGPSGSGKTYGAMLLAAGLTKKGIVAFGDSEHGRCRHYAPLIKDAEFHVFDITPPYTPEKYVQVIEAAEKAGYDVLILDSISHEWEGSGGSLEIHYNETMKSKSQNSYIAWGNVTPRHQAFIAKIVNSNLHIICSMRSKTAYDTSGQEGGKMKVKEVGQEVIQRQGVKYEFITRFEIDLETHKATAPKDMTHIFSKRKDPFLLSVDDGKALREYADEGAVRGITKDQGKEIFEICIQHGIFKNTEADMEKLKAIGAKDLTHNNAFELLVWLQENRESGTQVDFKKLSDRIKSLLEVKNE